MTSGVHACFAMLAHTAIVLALDALLLASHSAGIRWSASPGSISRSATRRQS